MSAAMTVAFDSGERVVVTVSPDNEEGPLLLSIGSDPEDLALTELEAQRVIDGLSEGLARLRRLREPDAR